MERQRQGPQLHEAAEKRIIVKDMMSRDCIRFGETHSVREAVWLMSEMNLRRKSADPQPLFIQDRQGNLAGMISPWRLLESMIENLDSREASSLSDAELGKHFCRGFQTVIKDMALVDLPHISEDTTLSEVLKASVKMDIRVLPVCDENGRVLGLLSQADLLSGLAQVAECADGIRAFRGGASCAYRGRDEARSQSQGKNFQWPSFRTARARSLPLRRISKP